MSSHRPRPRRDISFPYPDDEFPAELEAVVQQTILVQGATILAVVHDDDGDWLLSDGVTDPNRPGACVLHEIAELVRHDPTLRELAVMAPGFAAYRSNADEPWNYEAFSYGDAPID